mmetsp:Transcript_10043/g.11268  ORF Transcript_10043/g.11268 Transcript_10043/m.11268 type:complete len:293 (+) Transcript_10043:75-953(+)
MKFSLAATLLTVAAFHTVSAQENGPSLTTDNSTVTELVDPNVTPTLTTTAPQGEDGELQTIPEVAIASSDFNTLVALLTQADLVDTLSGEGPFTVFAPKDAAFEDLERVNSKTAKLLPCLMLPMYQDQLTAILTYHVADGMVMSADLTNGGKIPMLHEEVSTTIIGKTILLNSAAVDDGIQVIGGDIVASNGVIHPINGILIPPSIDVNDFLVLCREENPDLQPAAGGAMDEALAEDMASGGKELGIATNEKDGTEGTAGGTEEAKEEDSAASVITTLGSIVAAAVVTVFGM